MTESAELVKAGPTAVEERQAVPAAVREVLEARRNLQAQDDQLILDAYRGGFLDRVRESIRVCPTGLADGDDGAPVFASVGLTENPDLVLGPMTNRAFVVRHVAVRPAETNGGAAPLPGTVLPALPGAPPSRSSHEEAKA